MRCALADMARTHGWRLREHPAKVKKVKEKKKKVKKTLAEYMAERERFGFVT